MFVIYILFRSIFTISDFICIERFIATSVTNKTPKIHVLSKILGMKKLMVVFYAICFAYTMAILFGNGFSIRKDGTKYK
jgi:type II secretory pathway component PulF